MKICRLQFADPIAASDMPGRASGRKPPVLPTGEIGDLITHFAASVCRAEAGTFDVVVLHGVHGHLLNSFLSLTTNRRTDKYNGSPTQPAENIRRIVHSARKTVGLDYPIFIEQNCNHLGKNEAAIAGLVEMASEIEKAGGDALDISGTNALRTQIDSPKRNRTSSHTPTDQA